MARRGLIAVLLVLAVGLVAASTAAASWKANGSGSGSSKARSLSAGNTPTASVSNRKVSVSWTATTGVPLDGYIVRRYNGAGVAQTIGAACTGTINALTCTESKVPAGSWRYTVTPAKANWRGAQSAFSTAVTVAAPSMSLNASTVNSFPTSLTGQLTNFIDGQTVSFRLDDPSTGTVLSSSLTPSTVPASGTASFSVTIPAGTSNGSHTIYAIGSDGDQTSIAITVNAPKVTSSVIAKATGGDSGYLRQGRTYYVYANVSGSGSPPAGLGSLTANVANISTTATAPLTNGTYTVGGQSYNYRTAVLTAKATIAEGSTAYSLNLTDSGGTSTTTNHSVIIDNTAPTATDVQTTNVAAGTNGKAELGDTITYTYSEPIEPVSILSTWDGTSTPVVVRLVNNATADQIQIFNAGNTAALPIGTTSLGRTDYVTSTITFGATGTASTMVRSGSTVTVTLGTQSAAATTAAGTGTMSWTPSATATDRGGTAAATTAATESGAADKDF